ncbi:MAG TPA: hypothetical protein DCX06_09990 [Opitutae bacterium]|nr:hypothetical protein [Opitutae bacterium]
MHLLTSDRLTKSQLLLLLRELGYAPRFHSSVSEMEDALEGSDSNTLILIDLSTQISTSELDTLVKYKKQYRIIGFERLDTNSTSNLLIPAHTFETAIIIPSNGERAKLRLKNALKLGGQKQKSTRAPFGVRHRPMSTLSKLAKTALDKTEAISSRYIITESPASYTLLKTLKAASTQEGAFILEAKEEVEFELIAREFNYLSNSDKAALFIIQPENLRIDSLEKLERAATRDGIPINCYVGRTDELDEVAASELELFCNYLSNLRNPHARLIVGHEIGTEDLYREGVATHMSSLFSKAKRIQIPSLRDRPSDIPTICQLTLSHLRSAHPFLFVHRVSQEAETYLSEQRNHYSYTKLVRILRNAIALSKRETLSVEDIKNYGESDMTTQHLLETMADESYFPQSANF